MTAKLKIDVCIPTIKGVPDQIINEVKKETTGTIHISKIKPLVKARVELIGKVMTPLMLFLDDDIIYREGLLSLLFEHFSYCSNEGIRIGGVQGSTVPYGLGDKWDDALTVNIPPHFIDHGQRLMSSNMLIKTDLVKDWIPDRDVSGCEDLSLTNHIHSKGFKCLIVPLHVKHKRSWSKVKSNGLWYARGYVRVMGKLGGFKQLVKTVLASCNHLLLLPFNFRLSAYTIYQNFYSSLGFVKVLLFE